MILIHSLHRRIVRKVTENFHSWLRGLSASVAGRRGETGVRFGPFAGGCLDFSDWVGVGFAVTVCANACANRQTGQSPMGASPGRRVLHTGQWGGSSAFFLAGRTVSFPTPAFVREGY